MEYKATICKVFQWITILSIEGWIGVKGAKAATEAGQKTLIKNIEANLLKKTDPDYIKNMDEITKSGRGVV